MEAAELDYTEATPVAASGPPPPQVSYMAANREDAYEPDSDEGEEERDKEEAAPAAAVPASPSLSSGVPPSPSLSSSLSEPITLTGGVSLPPPLWANKPNEPTTPLTPLPLETPHTRHYYVAKPFNHMKMSDAISLEVWSTVEDNKAALNAVYSTGAEMVVFFSVNKSQHIQGYAVVKSLAEVRTEPGSSVPGPFIYPNGATFTIEWRVLADVNWSVTDGITNSLNEGKDVKIARDMQEIEAIAGAKVLKLVNEALESGGQTRYPEFPAERQKLYSRLHLTSPGEQGYPANHPVLRGTGVTPAGAWPGGAPPSLASSAQGDAAAAKAKAMAEALVANKMGYVPRPPPPVYMQQPPRAVHSYPPAAPPAAEYYAGAYPPVAPAPPTEYYGGAYPPVESHRGRGGGGRGRGGPPPSSRRHSHRSRSRSRSRSPRSRSRSPRSRRDRGRDRDRERRRDRDRRRSRSSSSSSSSSRGKQPDLTKMTYEEYLLWVQGAAPAPAAAPEAAAGYPPHAPATQPPGYPYPPRPDPAYAAYGAKPEQGYPPAAYPPPAYPPSQQYPPPHAQYPPPQQYPPPSQPYPPQQQYPPPPYGGAGYGAPPRPAASAWPGYDPAAAPPQYYAGAYGKAQAPYPAR